jgi:hypothetical protein
VARGKTAITSSSTLGTRAEGQTPLKQERQAMDFVATMMSGD